MTIKQVAIKKAVSYRLGGLWALGVLGALLGLVLFGASAQAQRPLPDMTLPGLVPNSPIVAVRAPNPYLLPVNPDSPWLASSLQGLPSVVLEASPFGYHSHAPKRLTLRFSDDWLNQPDTGFTARPLVPVVTNPKGKRWWWQPNGPVLFKAAPIVLPLKTSTVLLNLTPLQTEGTLELRLGKPVKTQTSSVLDVPVFTLRLNDSVFWDLLSPVVRSYVLHRSGLPLRDPVSGIVWSAGHLNDASPSPELALEAQKAGRILGSQQMVGGWYEGPTYTKNVVSNALVAARLLGLYQISPRVMANLKLNYPAGYKARVPQDEAELPDLLTEARFGLDWLQTMQDEQTGGFYEQVISPVAPKAFSQPAQDSGQRLFTPPTIESTAAATAALARAARVFKPVDLSVSVQSLRAAQKGYEALQRAFIKDPLPCPQTLAYTAWAAQELALATQGTASALDYQQMLAALLSPQTLAQWQDNPPLPWVFALENTLEASDAAEASGQPLLFKDELLNQVKRLQGLAQQNAVGLPLAPNEHLANAALLERANLLLDAYRLTLNSAYRDTATEVLNYILGVNPWHQPFITGDPDATETNTLARPCNALVQAARKPIAGLLVPGPWGYWGGHLGGALPEGDLTDNQALPLFNDSPSNCLTNGTGLVETSSLMAVLAQLNLAYNHLDPALQPQEQAQRASQSSRQQALPSLED